MLVTGFIMATISYLLLAMMPFYETWLIYLPIFALSQFWSIYGSVMVSSISLISSQRAMPLSFGVAFFMQNIGTSSLPFYFGWLTRDGSVNGF